MIDLERLIAQKQDALRGRPLNWRDGFIDWMRRVDWWGVGMVICIAVWGIAYTLENMIEVMQ
jgi:hypothetical protein